MRLTDLDPKFIDAGGEGIERADGSPSPKRTGVGMAFDCPCGGDCPRIYISFANPIDGGETLHAPGWRRTGERFDVITIEPSIIRLDNCGWHGWIRSGEVTTC